jgi:uncharacterized protein
VIELPPLAAWRHLGAREGFEVVFLRREGDGYRLDGQSAALEEGEAFGARYTVTLDAGWVTRSAVVAGLSGSGAYEVRLEGDGNGEWRIDGEPAPQLGGCLDVDLEASACTNAFPVKRLDLSVGEASDAPAAYVQASDSKVERLEQHYRRLEDDEPKLARYDYDSPAFDFHAILTYDEFGLVLDYPGIAVRVA